MISGSKPNGNDQRRFSRKSGSILIVVLFKLIVLSFFLITIIISFLLTIVIFKKLLFIPTFNEKKTERFEDYQTLWYNSSDHKFSFGRSVIPEVLSGHSSFISFNILNKEHDRIYTLISKFGEVEYICTGNCYCIDDKEDVSRRAHSSSIHHALTYLLVAFSLSSAYSLSKKYFEEACVNELQDSCSDISSIQSEVSDCDLVMFAASPTDRKDNPRSVTINEETEKEGVEKVLKFQCIGRCDERSFFYKNIGPSREDRIKVRKQVGIGDCRDLGVRGIFIYIVIPSSNNVLTSENLHLNNNGNVLLFKAGSEFRDHFLHPFCTKNSAISPNGEKIVFFEFLRERGEKTTITKENMEIPNSWCEGVDTRTCAYIEYLSSVRCGIHYSETVLKKDLKGKENVIFELDDEEVSEIEIILEKWGRLREY